MFLKVKCVDCWEDLGDWQTPFTIPKEIQKRISDHVKKGHAVQEIEI